MSREEFTQKSKELEKSELRLLLLPIVAFVLPVAAFAVAYQHMALIPRARMLLGGVSFTAWFLSIPVMLRLYVSRARQLGLECPGCGRRLAGKNAMNVQATARCAFCGHQIIT